MNLFIGILGVVVIAVAVVLGGMKFVENDKLKKNLEKKKITEEEYRRSSKRYVGECCRGYFRCFLGCIFVQLCDYTNRIQRSENNVWAGLAKDYA